MRLQYKALIFDLDGTLIDSVPDIAPALNKALHQFGLQTFELETVRGWVGNGARVLVQRAMSAQSSQPNKAILDDVHQTFLQFYGDNVSQNSCLYAGVADTLAMLSNLGLPMALVTNKPIAFVPELLNKFQIDKYFSVVFGGDSLAEKKPHPLPLLEACKQLDVPPHQVLMVGDSKNDIFSAQAAKIPVLGLTYGYNYGEDIALYKPDYLADHFATLLEVVTPTEVTQ